MECAWFEFKDAPRLCPYFGLFFPSWYSLCSRNQDGFYICSMLGSEFSFQVELPLSRASGGILVAWKHHLGPVVATKVDNFFVSVQFGPNDRQAWWITCVYGPQGDDNKLLFLQEFNNVRQSVMCYCSLPVRSGCAISLSGILWRWHLWREQ